MHQLINNLVGTLAADITAVATSATITLMTYSGTLPVATADSPFYLTICNPSNRLYNEIVKVTNVSGTTLTISRAQRSTTAQAWTAGAHMSLNVCAEDVNVLYPLYPAATLVIDEWPDPTTILVPESTRYVDIDLVRDGGTLTLVLPDEEHHVGHFVSISVNVAAATPGQDAPKIEIYDADLGYGNTELENGSHWYYCNEAGEWVDIGSMYALGAITVDVAKLMDLYPANMLSIEAKPNPLAVAVPESTRFVIVSFSANDDTMTLTLPNAEHHEGSWLLVALDITDAGGTATKCDIDMGLTGTLSHVPNGAWLFFCPMAGYWIRLNDAFAGEYVEDYIDVDGNVSASTVTLTQDAVVLSSIKSFNSGTAHGLLNFYAARGTSTSPASLNLNDVIGYIYGRSWSTGTTYHASGIFLFQATQDHSSTAAGTKAEVWTTPNDSTTASVSLRVGQDKTLTAYGDITLPPTSAVYLGDKTTTGTWRMIRSGDDLVFERYNGANWIVCGTIDGTPGT